MKDAHAHPPPSELTLELKDVPPLLDAKGVQRHVANLSRTFLYQAASDGEIQSVSLGMGKKGKRLFVTESILKWIRRRAANNRALAMGASKKGSQDRQRSDVGNKGRAPEGQAS